MTLTMTKTIFMPNFEFMVDPFGNESCIIYLCNGSIAVYDETANTKILYHGYYDAQGSLIALTNNSGNVLARYAYAPWGKRVAALNWGYIPSHTIDYFQYITPTVDPNKMKIVNPEKPFSW